MLAHFQHPNIVRLYHGGAVEGRLYYAMDFVDGIPFGAVGLCGITIAHIAGNLDYQVARIGLEDCDRAAVERTRAWSTLPP